MANTVEICKVTHADPRCAASCVSTTIAVRPHYCVILIIMFMCMLACTDSPDVAREIQPQQKKSAICTCEIFHGSKLYNLSMLHSQQTHRKVRKLWSTRIRRWS